MKRIKSICGIFLLFFLAFFLINCSGGGGGGDSSGSSKSLSQSSIDSQVMWAVNKSIKELYNEKVVGSASGTDGSRNIMGSSCPLGGTVNITGTATNNNGTTTVDLIYDMTNCKMRQTASSAIIELTMSGISTMIGSFNATTKYKNLIFDATGLVLNGTIQRDNYNDASVSDTVDYFSMEQQDKSDAVQTTGTIDGRLVSWTSGSSDDSDDDTDGTDGGSSETWTDNFTLTEIDDSFIGVCTYTTTGKITMHLNKNGTSVTGTNDISDLHYSVAKADGAICVPRSTACANAATHEILPGTITATQNSGNLNFSSFNMAGCLADSLSGTGIISGSVGQIMNVTLTGTTTWGDATVTFAAKKQ